MLRGRNDGLIRAPIITENDGFFTSRWYAIPEYSGGVFAAIAAGGSARDPKRPFNPAHTGSFLVNLYNEFFLFFHRAFFALKYAIGTTGFTVILRATGRIWAIFNQIFALTFAAGVDFSLDNLN